VPERIRFIGYYCNGDNNIVLSNSNRIKGYFVECKAYVAMIRMLVSVLSSVNEKIVLPPHQEHHLGSGRHLTITTNVWHMQTSHMSIALGKLNG
jgi:hypothetical protein